jgi:hypothetical protein
MWKKISIQAILFILAIVLIFFTYDIYFKSDELVKVNKIEESKQEVLINPQDTKIKKNVEASNLVKDLNYISKDAVGNEYRINSKYSELNLESVNIINMRDVSAKITMLNKEPLFVTSKFAIYNNENYDTTFLDNVEIKYLESIINSEKFEISIEDNFAKVSKQVIYQNPSIKLNADIIEIDLITKNSKIFMIDKNKKIEIINK